MLRDPLVSFTCAPWWLPTEARQKLTILSAACHSRNEDASLPKESLSKRAGHAFPRQCVAHVSQTHWQSRDDSLHSSHCAGAVRSGFGPKATRLVSCFFLTANATHFVSYIGLAMIAGLAAPENFEETQRDKRHTYSFDRIQQATSSSLCLESSLSSPSC